MNLINFYEDVQNWNFFAGNSLSKENIEKTYLSLVKEETNEIVEGVDEKNHDLFLDGLVASLVVTSFLCSIQEHLKNKEFLDNYNLSPVINDFNFFIQELKALKGYVPEKFESDSDKEKSLQLIKINSLSILKLVESYVQSLNLPFVDACFEIMRSNWSKFPLVSETDPEFEIEFIESQGRYKDVYFLIKQDQNGIDRYIFKDGNGKILKPSKFSEPNLTPYLTKDFLEMKL